MSSSSKTTEKAVCGKPATSTGKPCQWKTARSPCPHHDPKKKSNKGKGVSKNRAVLRKEIMIQEQLKGASVVDAGRKAGYAETTLRSRIYQIIASPDYKARIQAHIEAASLDTDEIIGTLVSQMRGDLSDVFPEADILKLARQNGVSHLIKKIEQEERFISQGIDEEPIRVVNTKVELYSAQDAAKQLTKVFGLEQLPAPNQKARTDFNAAVERLMQAAIDGGISLRGEKLRKEVEERLKPLYPILQSNAVN